MKKAIKVLFAFLLMLITIPGSFAAGKNSKPKIKTVDNYLAVFDFEVTTGDKGISRPLADRVIHVLSQSDKYEIIDRGNMNKILGEQKFQMSGCVAQECKVEAKGAMLKSGVSRILNTLLSGAGLAMSLILCVMCFPVPVFAAPQAPDAAGREQTSFIVYLHPVATDVEILVDDLVIYKTGSVFGVWCYQFNVTSFLDSKPRTVEIRTRLGNKDAAYCDAEVRKIEGNPAKTTLLAKKTIRAADLETWNKDLVALTIEIALPEKSTKPLWAEYIEADLKPAMRNTYVELMKETFTAMQQGNLESLMTLIGPALTNQARMEGAPPDLLKQTIRSKLQRCCIPNISVAATERDFYDETYTDRMAPLNFETMGYFCIKEPGREDTKGNLYSPEEPIRFYTKKNHLFVARIFISCTHDGSKKWFVSRFIFDRTE